jgi:predicted ATPase
MCFALRAARRLLDLRVRRLEIETFRLLRRTRIDLPSDLTVLVGPNGAGKSTVLDAVEFVRQAVVNGLGAALERVRGIERLRTAGTTAPVSIALGFHADIGESARTPGEYGFELRARVARDHDQARHEPLARSAACV